MQAFSFQKQVDLCSDRPVGIDVRSRLPLTCVGAIAFIVTQTRLRFLKILMKLSILEEFLQSTPCRMS
jgi:hypothetical protein